MKIQIPTNCPCCDHVLELVNEQLFCRNTACPAQLSKKLEHFCKVLGIKGMGPKTLEKLALNDITEIYYLDLDQIIEALGSEKLATKLLEEINNSKNVGLADVLTSFSIPLIGKTASDKICSVVSHIDDINDKTCKLAGLGEKATNNLLNWLEIEFVQIKEFLPFSFYSNNKPESNTEHKTVCITGKLSSFKNKLEAHKALEAAGYKPVDSVTKSTDYLVDEDNKGSSKRTKADSIGIKIIPNLNTFLKEINND